jgi:hypothetical protein
VKLWLNEKGDHWSTPAKANQFRNVLDGNLRSGGVGVRSEVVSGKLFLSGVYLGKGDATRVVIVTQDGNISGTVVKLAGAHGWGAWYAKADLPTTAIPKSKQKRGFIRSVVVHDIAGRTIAKYVTPSYA